jgi:signal transduction histidine kinase
MGQFARDSQTAEAQRCQTITALSHDLRTPISSIQAMVEALADGVVTDPATVRRYHEALRDEVVHLSALLDGLFELSRLESGVLALKRERTDVAELIADAVRARAECAERARVALRCQVEGVVPPIVVDARELYRVADCLLDNALRYTAAGGTILVRVSARSRSRDGRDVLVQVIDTGSGIAEHDLPHIFEPSYRADAARIRAPVPLARHRRGCQQAGLGLTIAARIITAHGGRIWAASPTPAGLRARVSRVRGFPLPLTAGPGTVLSFSVPVSA